VPGLGTCTTALHSAPWWEAGEKTWGWKAREKVVVDLLCPVSRIINEPMRAELEPSRACVDPSSSLSTGSEKSQARLKIIKLELADPRSLELGSLTTLVHTVRGILKIPAKSH
jgi:hypothetical protein